MISYHERFAKISEILSGVSAELVEITLRRYETRLLFIAIDMDAKVTIVTSQSVQYLSGTSGTTNLREKIPPVLDEGVLALDFKFLPNKIEIAFTCGVLEIYRVDPGEMGEIIVDFAGEIQGMFIA